MGHCRFTFQNQIIVIQSHVNFVGAYMMLVWIFNGMEKEMVSHLLKIYAEGSCKTNMLIATLAPTSVYNVPNKSTKPIVFVRVSIRSRLLAWILMQNNDSDFFHWKLIIIYQVPNRMWSQNQVVILGKYTMYFQLLFCNYILQILMLLHIFDKF